MDATRNVRRGRNLGGLIVLLMLFLSWVLSSCSDSTEPIESVGTAEEAVVQTSSLTVTLPGGSSVQNFLLGSLTTMDLRDRVNVQGRSLSGTGNITIGIEAKLKDVWGKGNVTVGQRATITGDAKAGGILSVSPSAVVTGVKQSNVSFGAAVTKTFSFSADSVSAGPVTVTQGQVRDLAPGTYTSLNVGSNATLIVHTGVYSITGAVTFEASSKLSVDSRNGPVQIYLKGNLTYRGAIQASGGGIPQLLIGKLGSGSALLDASYTGVLLAPAADVALQAARPNGHRAIVYGKTVRLEPDTIVKPYPFNWSAVDPTLYTPPPPNQAVLKYPPSLVNIPVAVTKSGEATDNHAHTDTPVTFTMPQTYSVKGGTIGNGTVTFTFKKPDGTTVICTYQGAGTTAAPITATELNAGRTLNFVSCSDGLPPSTPRTGVDFTLHVDPIEGYPVVVAPPMQLQTGECTDEFPILSPQQTTQMRESFSWAGTSSANFVQSTNPDGTPALYYAWILIRNAKDALNLRKLLIHQLRRPLFQQELDAFSGRCGAFSNPGDGYGTFVPVLIPGTTYNKLLQLIIGAPYSPDISGDRTIFDAIILRNAEVPAAARNANGSVRLDLLAQSHFRYLDYETDPLPRAADITEAGGGVSKVLVDAFVFVASTAESAATLVKQGIAELDKLLRGTITVTLDVHAINHDPAFAHHSLETIMVRHWGKALQGKPLGANGAQVTILQQFLDLRVIPEVTIGYTDMTGRVTMDVVDSGERRGSGFCIELKTDAARITEFLLPGDICDLRTLTDATKGQDLIKSLSFEHSFSAELKLFSSLLVALYQSDDSYQWAKTVLGDTPPAARILWGYWAETFAPQIKYASASDPNRTVGRIFTPCLHLAGAVLSDEIMDASVATGLLNVILPGILPAGVQLILDAFATIVAQSDIVFPNITSTARESRLIMSHEYGHYLFCDLLQDRDVDAVDTLIFETIAAGDDTRTPVRYLNEAMADFFSGQVTGGVSYAFLDSTHALSHKEWDNSTTDGFNHYCVSPRNLEILGGVTPPTPASKPCLDTNLRGSATSAEGAESAGRVMTLLQDVFDGRSAGKPSDVPNDGDQLDLQDPETPTAPDADLSDDVLVLTSELYGNPDSVLDRVALQSNALMGFAESLASLFTVEGGGALSDGTIYAAVDAMIEDYSSATWCDRCAVLALHSPGFCDNTALPQCHDPADARSTPEFAPTPRAVLDECIKSPLISGALLAKSNFPPDADGRVEFATCQVCGPDQISDDQGHCVTCPVGQERHGNKCGVCTSDVIVDGTTMPTPGELTFDPTITVSGDTCPEFFWVQVNSPQAINAKGYELTGGVQPTGFGQTSCERPYELSVERYTGSFFEIFTTKANAGVWTCPPGGGLCICNNLPTFSFATSLLADGTPVRFGMPSNDATKRLVIFGKPPIEK